MCYFLKNCEQAAAHLCLGIKYQLTEREPIIQHPVFIPSRNPCSVIQIYLNNHYLFGVRNFSKLYDRIKIDQYSDFLYNLVGVHLQKQRRGPIGEVAYISNMFFDTSNGASLFQPFYIIDPDFEFYSPKKIDIQWQKEGF